jgi:hypothetical protein
MIPPGYAKSLKFAWNYFQKSQVVLFDEINKVKEESLGDRGGAGII